MARQNGGQPTLGDALPDRPSARIRNAMSDARKAASADQMVADADQSASDADQVSSDVDQIAADREQIGADRDQLASDQDQATADRDRADHGSLAPADEVAYASSRENREHASLERIGNRIRRQATARDRDLAATDRDRMAEIRDEGGRSRDAHGTDLELPSSGREAQLHRDLGALRALAAEDRARAAEDRARAAEDRARAAADRAGAAGERARLEAELEAAHLDELTGAYRRGMGRLAVAHEIDRARRAGGSLVVAFIDVDELKTVNDRDGHAAGDRVLQTVVQAMRARLRSFDSISRYGGDEFVCALGGTTGADAERRFDLIGVAIEADARVGISVGFAELEPDDTADGLTERADAAMRGVRAARRDRQLPSGPDTPSPVVSHDGAS